MRRSLLAAIMIFLLFVAPGSARGGELSAELSNLTSTSSSDSLVRVWILLPPESSKPDFQAMAKAAGPDRASQHRVLVGNLKSEGLARQQVVAGRLDQLAAIGRAARVKRHWITGVIEAEVAAGELNSLAARNDIATIIPEPQVSLIRPVDDGSAGAISPDGNLIPNHIFSIRADSAWDLGYTGAGRVICSFDNGVDGNHIALKNTWKGLDGDSAAAWFDPVTNQKAPHVVGAAISNPAHGTHVMGLLVGRSDSVWCGVAPGTKWISAAVIDIPGASVLDAFEWAADPDGDPNTVDDVPDVINHSWALSPNTYYLGCRNVFFDVIDKIEALGIVNIFAAGNDGTTASINNPANGNLDSLYAFGVGALDIGVTPPKRASISSKGPSDCPGPSHKPNVMAPGQSVYSTYPSNSYQTLTGTSMAAPQVAGLVALLRQKNPNATVDEIKLAILNSTSHVLQSGPFPNDSLGWGEIDCIGALNALSGSSAQPNVRLYDFTHAPISPGDTVVGTLVLQNLGAQALAVSAAIMGSVPSLIVLNGSAAFGDINSRDTVRSGNIIRVVVSDTVTGGTLLSLPLVLSGSNFGPDTTTLGFLVGSRGYKSFATHTTGRIQFTVSNYGVLGLGPLSIFPAGGQGFRLDGRGNDLFEGGILAANGPIRNAGAVHSFLNEPKMDFVVAPGGNLVFMQPGPLSHQEVRCVLADDNADSPLGLNVVQESFSDSTPDDNFVLLRYAIQNKTSSLISGLNFGLFLDWDLPECPQNPNPVLNAGAFSTGDSILWMARSSGSTGNPILSGFRGVILLDGMLATALTRKAQVAYNTWYLPGVADGFTTQERYSALFAGFVDSVKYRDSLLDLFQLMAAGPLNLAPGEIDTVAFAVIAGADLTAIRDAASRARDKYRNVITDVETPPDGALPSSFTLYQNYPNPFNPTTKISFMLPRESDYTLRIYNLLGQVVDRIDGHAQSGRVELVWDAGDRATGLYLYRIDAGSFSASRKMLLLK